MENNSNSVTIFNRLADVYQEKYMDIGLYHESLNRFCEQIINEAHILELACGPGNITKYLLHKRPDFKILGTDLAINMLNLARANNPEAEFELMDCRAINGIAKKYDAIVCGFCLPYLTKTEALQLIKDSKDILTAKGVLYISTMENSNYMSGYQTSSSGDTMFINYHESDYLTNALKQNGYDIKDLQRIKYPGKDGAIITDLIIIAGL